jgi:hypothetical protein
MAKITIRFEPDPALDHIDVLIRAREQDAEVTALMERLSGQTPDTITVFEPSVFYGSGIKSLTLPAQLKTVKRLAFYDCKSLESLVFPEGMVERAEDAVKECPNLKSVTLPASMKSISDNNFSGCENVVIHAPEGSYAYAWAMENHIPVEKQ